MPHLPPVQKIELSSSHAKLRLVAAALLLLIGAGALAYTIMGLMTPQTGWQEIEVSSSSELSCGSEFVFLYDLGASGIAASAEARALTAVYTEASIHAYRLFDTVQSWDGVTNLYDLNHHPNEVLEVEDTLYQAFALLERYDSRALYLGPVYGQYQALFFCNNDVEAADFDPFVNEIVRSFVTEAAAFARDPDAVALELLGDNRVRLNVSPDYLAWAEENEVTCFLDFFWLKNAFVADYLADTLTGGGYTLGTLSSYDGFIRNLDDSGTSYSLNIYDRVDRTVYQAAIMEYTGVISLVYLRDYPLNSQDFQHYYEWENGELRSPYADIADGLCRVSLPNLVSYSRKMGCAEVLLQALPVYIGEEFSPAAVAALADTGVWSVYCQDRVIHSNGSGVTFTSLYSRDEISYSLAP